MSKPPTFRQTPTGVPDSNSDSDIKSLGELWITHLLYSRHLCERSVGNGDVPFWKLVNQYLFLLVQITQLYKTFQRFGLERGAEDDAVEDVAVALGVSRAAVYVRANNVGCSVEDLRKPGLRMDQLLAENDKLAELLGVIGAAIKRFNVPVDVKPPTVRRRRRATRQQDMLNHLK